MTSKIINELANNSKNIMSSGIPYLKHLSPLCVCFSALNYIETGSHSILDNCLLGNSTLSAPLQTLPPQILNEDNQIRHVNGIACLSIDRELFKLISFLFFH